MGSPSWEIGRWPAGAAVARKLDHRPWLDEGERVVGEQGWPCPQGAYGRLGWAAIRRGLNQGPW